MLELRDINVAYGKVQVLFNLTLVVQPGTIHCLLGRNGAGKTTALKAVMGLLPLRSGSVFLDSHEISALPAHEIPGMRIGFIPQGRRLFSELTVAENLEIGLMTRRTGRETRDRILAVFPRLRERLDQAAGTLSGGEQQMLAMARTLCIEPIVLLLDEPTEGLQPSMIEQIRRVILDLKHDGVAILLVEQKVDAVLSIADTVTFLENGRNQESIAASELHRDRTKIARYLGV